MNENPAIEEINKHLVSIFTCCVCGKSLYPTDQCNLETTLHCSSIEARFWDFERGSLEQLKAKEHWDKSRKAVHLENI
jgi:hypothetical protein